MLTELNFDRAAFQGGTARGQSVHAVPSGKEDSCRNAALGRGEDNVVVTGPGGDLHGATCLKLRAGENHVAVAAAEIQIDRSRAQAGGASKKGIAARAA